MMAELNNKNPELETKKIQLSDHAYKRVRERLGYKDKDVALGQIRGMLRQAKRIGTVYGEDGNEGIYYAFNKVGIVLSPDLKCVITIKKTEEVTEPLKSKVLALHRKEFNKLDRIEKSKAKKLIIEKLRIDSEIAQLRYRKVKTRSKNVKKCCEEKINQLLNEIIQLEDEIKNIQSLKRKIANSMASVI